MLVKKRMSSPPITIEPDVPIMDALKLMQRENIRRAPVVKKGKMVGIVSDKDLLNAAPSDATSLSIWEVNYLMARIKVKDVMTKDVIAIAEDTPIEEAARIMADNKIGGVPVLRGEEVVGIITETDLFKIFLELMGARDPGVRVTALVPDTKGELAAISRSIADAGGSFVSFGQFSSDPDDNCVVTFKIEGIAEDEVIKSIKPYIIDLIDVRST